MSDDGLEGEVDDAILRGMDLRVAQVEKAQAGSVIQRVFNLISPEHAGKRLRVHLGELRSGGSLSLASLNINQSDSLLRGFAKMYSADPRVSEVFPPHTSRRPIIPRRERKNFKGRAYPIEHVRDCKRLLPEIADTLSHSSENDEVGLTEYPWLVMLLPTNTIRVLGFLHADVFHPRWITTGHNHWETSRCDCTECPMKRI